MNVLVVAPHADDEVLGCGGILAKYAKAGHHTYVAIMTNAHYGAPEIFSKEVIEKIREEAVNAHRVLQVKKTFFYDYPAPRLETYPSYEIADVLGKLIKELSIQVLYLPHRGDMHKDHEVIYNAGLVAARPVNNCPVKEIYTYETLSETDWAPPFGSEVFIPNVFEDVTDSFSLKLKAMECFGSQLKPFPNSRSLKALEALAQVRGATVNYNFAEAFALIRMIK